MQIYTRHQWRNAKVKSDGSRWKGLTPYTCLCYRCCALEQGTKRRALKGTKQSASLYGPLLLKIAPREMKHALKMHVPVCLYILHRIRIMWLYQYSIAQMFCQSKRITPKWIYTVLKNFPRSGFLSNWHLPWKQSFLWKFSSRGCGSPSARASYAYGRNDEKLQQDFEKASDCNFQHTLLPSEKHMRRSNAAVTEAGA